MAIEFDSYRVVLEEKSAGETLLLTHYTAGEYLTRQLDCLFPSTKKVIAKTCLRYMSFIASNNPRMGGNTELKKQPHTKYPFLRYAATYWMHHVISAGDDKMKDAVLEFLADEGRRRRVMSVHHQIYLSTSRIGLLPEPNLSAQHIAAYLSLVGAAASFLDAGHIIDERNES